MSTVKMAERPRTKRSKSSQHPPPLVYRCVPARELTDEVLKRTRPFALPADRTVFRAGDAPNGVFFVRNGKVALTIRSTRRMVLHMRAEPGSMIGLPSTVSEQPYSITARASAGAQVERLSPESYRQLVESRPRLSVEVLKILASEIRAIRRVLVNACS